LEGGVTHHSLHLAGVHALEVGHIAEAANSSQSGQGILSEAGAHISGKLLVLLTGGRVGSVRGRVGLSLGLRNN